jgi:hypothetical protein
MCSTTFILCMIPVRQNKSIVPADDSESRNVSRRNDDRPQTEADDTVLGSFPALDSTVNHARSSQPRLGDRGVGPHRDLTQALEYVQ